MAKTCFLCGKGPQFGRNIRHVHSGSWERKAPRTNRRWLPNLQSARILVENEPTRIRVCAKCLKAGKVARV